MWRRHCSIGQSYFSMTSKRSIDWFPESSVGYEVFSPEHSLNQPIATSVCILSTKQSNRAISVCLLFLFCSRVFISRSYENRSQKTVNVYTADVTHLKGRRHAICYLFERDKQSPRINWFPKIMIHFFLTFLDYMTYLGTENVTCYCCKGLARRSQRFQVLMLSIKNYYG